MLRYFVLLIIACSTYYGSTMLERTLHDWRTVPTHTVSTPAVSELAKRLAFPVAYSMGGTGWGPLGAVIITAGLAGGFWAGWLLGWLALGEKRGQS